MFCLTEPNRFPSGSKMNYDQVSMDDEEVQVHVVVEPRPLDLKHKILYTCVGIILTSKVILICWIFTLSFPSDALSFLFHWWE